MATWIKEKFLRISKWLVFIAIIPFYINFVEAMGHRIKLTVPLGETVAQPDIVLDYTLGILWAIFLGFTIFLWPVSTQDKRALVRIWGVKCFVMLVLMLFYENYYQTDSFGYFSVGHRPMSEWKALEVQGGGVCIVSIVRAHVLTFLDSFHAVKVSFGMVGLLGVYIFYRAAVLFLQKEKRTLLYLLAFFPSILFFSSIIGKEPFILLPMAIYCYGVVKYARQKSLVAVIIVLVGLAGATAMRSWMGFILLVPFFVLLIFTIKRKLSILAWVMVLMMAFGMVCVTWISGKAVIKKMGGASSYDFVQIANLRYNGFARGGSSVGNNNSYVFQNEVKYHNIKEVIFFIPLGMFTDLFRPLPGEVHNLFGLLAGLEDLVLMGLFCFAVRRTRFKELTDPVMLWAITLIVIWSCVYAFVSYNLGTDYRYRFQILPLFLLLLLYLSRRRAV